MIPAGDYGGPPQPLPFVLGTETLRTFFGVVVVSRRAVTLWGQEAGFGGLW